jgi:peptidylprolyl isomerase
MRRAAALALASCAALTACHRAVVVRPGDRLLVAYELSVDGAVVETNFAQEPLTVVQGNGALPPGADAALLGMSVGQEKRVEIPPEKAFGPRDPNLLETMALKDFGELAAGLAPGKKVAGFRDGRQQTASVVSVDGGKVVLDFNPPLAGKTVVYRLRVIALNPH